MKYLFMGLLSLTMYVGKAQQNRNAFLNASFWQKNPNVEAAKAAITNGSDPSELNNNAMDAVVLAINSDAPNETIQYLLEQKGNNVDKLTHDARTYIFWATMRGNLDIMQYLIGKGAKVNIQDSHGLTPLSFAAATNQLNPKVYDFLAKNGGNIKESNDDGANLLLQAIAADTSLALTEYFQFKGLALNSKDKSGSTAFDYAAKGGNVKLLKLLRQKNIPFTNNALLIAARGGRKGSNSLEVFQYLESIGIKPNYVSKTGENALHSIARRAGTKDIVTYFLEKGVDVNQKDKDGNTPFFNAAASNIDVETLRLLLPKVKNINDKNAAGASPLALAVRSNTSAVVRFLLESGADIHTTDNNGNSLVSYLFDSYSSRQAKEFQPKIKVLEEKGLAIATPLQDGNTLYHLAVAKNDLALVKWVHENYKVDVNTKNKEGLTPLHKAIMIAKNDDIIKYLISIGADKKIATNFDETTFDLASENEILKKNNVSIDFLK